MPETPLCRLLLGTGMPLGAVPVRLGLLNSSTNESSPSSAPPAPDAAYMPLMPCRLPESDERDRRPSGVRAPPSEARDMGRGGGIMDSPPALLAGRAGC